MSRPTPQRRDKQQRTLIAQTAARLIIEGGLNDYAQAMRKAAEQLHLGHHPMMPSSDELNAALAEYQFLFQQNGQQYLQQMRQTATQAMQQLHRFRPKVSGPLLLGTAHAESPITLHLFADNVEQVITSLLQHRIPFDQEERWLHYGKGDKRQHTVLHFIAGTDAIELLIFTPDSPPQPPLDPLSGKPLRRRGLLADGSWPSA